MVLQKLFHPNVIVVISACPPRAAVQNIQLRWKYLHYGRQVFLWNSWRLGLGYHKKIQVVKTGILLLENLFWLLWFSWDLKYQKRQVFNLDSWISQENTNCQNRYSLIEQIFLSLQTLPSLKLRLFPKIAWYFGFPQLKR